ncbi:MAG: arylsulfatase [Verrucomicrobia bacterium]|nr:arylsulfatase [Verrucomicrobiota bacterium]
MKHFFRKLALACAILAFILCNQLYAETRPNIVVILADDLGWGSVGCYGDTRLQTPHIDRLAKEGRLFRNAYATGSVCSPTRYALMTGRYYWRTSMKDGLVLPGNGPLHIETNRTTLASVIKSKGYQTAVIGKWHLGLGANSKVDWNAPLAPGPRAIGFDYFYGLAANYGNPPNLYIENETLLGVEPGKKIVVGSEGDEQEALQVVRIADDVMNKLTDKCVEWIGKNKKTPFFLYYAPIAVHEPITPAAKFTGSPFGKYGDFIHELDWSVGEILKALDQYKLADNTLVIFTSDNGGVAHLNNPSAGAAMKAGLAINGPFKGGKHDIYEGGLRAPFLVRWPGRVAAGSVCDDIVSMSDLVATTSSILKASLPKEYSEDSVDVSGSFFGKGKPARDVIVLQDSTSTYAVRQGKWKLIERENPSALQPRSEQHRNKLMQRRKGAPTEDELFNLELDPSESKNVAPAHPEIVKRLRVLLSETRGF